jgi:hypothetical protein
LFSALAIVRLKSGGVNSAVTPLRIQFCPRLGSFGDKRRDWPELAIQFLFEGALFRRGQVVKMFRFCGVRLLPRRLQPLQRIPPEFQIRHRILPAFGEFIVGALVQFPSGLRLADAAPLFKEEGDFRPLALRADVPHPVGSHWPRARSALAAHNHPIDALQIDRERVGS